MTHIKFRLLPLRFMNTLVCCLPKSFTKKYKTFPKHQEVEMAKTGLSMAGNVVSII